MYVEGGGSWALVFSNRGGYCFLSGVHVCIRGWDTAK